MVRYIDADRFKQVLADLYDYAKWDPREIHFSLFDMVGNIDGEPTADVAPVVHAHWVEDEDGVHCSKCKKDASLEVFTYSFHPTTDSWDGDVKFNKSEFCPHCGAKMDEEVETDE